jgi:hypothetical protein
MSSEAAKDAYVAKAAEMVAKYGAWWEDKDVCSVLFCNWIILHGRELMISVFGVNVTEGKMENSSSSTCLISRTFTKSHELEIHNSKTKKMWNKSFNLEIV